MLLAPAAMALATEQCVTSAADKLGGADLIDAHYFYPDGVAASKIARRLGLPFIVTGRGTDINLIAQMPGPRKMILAAARAAAAVVAVSRALANEMQSIGIDEKKIHVLRNGVDLAAFQPGDRAKARRTLGFDTVTFVSVGVLREAKGHNVAIEALLHIENSRLVIIGGGEYESQLRALVKRHRLGDRVTFTGRIDQAELCSYYQAADALLLLSRREGMPNVVLESLACGTPVIAANVGGLAEVVTGQDMGRLLGECAARAVADAWSSLLQHGVDRDRIRKAAERFSWDETVADLYRLMTRCAHKGRH
jgi:glycosyltransferase involved in cell wall biosynthesis